MVRGSKVGRSSVEKPDHRHSRLLRARRERPRGCAAEQVFIEESVIVTGVPRTADRYASPNARRDVSTEASPERVRAPEGEAPRAPDFKLRIPKVLAGGARCSRTASLTSEGVRKGL